MRILEINKFYYPRRGAERHFLDLLQLLERRGHETAVFSMRHPENLSSPFMKYFPEYVGYNAGDSSLWQRLMGIGRLFWSFQARRNMSALLKEWRPDIAHVHNMYHQLSPSILEPIRKLGIPIVMTVHDYNLISPDKDRYYPEIGRHYWKFLLVKKHGFLKRALLVLKMYWNQSFGFYEKSIDAYIAPSRFVKDVLVSAGLPEKKITVLPHFIPDSGESAAIEEDDEKYFALYFGSLSEEKGANDLAGIFDALHIPVVMAGKIEAGFSLRKSGYATLVGHKSKEELLRLIRKASCVVSASRLPETFGLIALEAIAFGKPFFGLRTGAYAEIIQNGKNGFLAENIEELQEYLADFFSGKHVFSSQEIREEARRRFGEAAYAEAFATLCRRLVDGK